MNRRERKKKRAGEFTELGFEMNIFFKQDATFEEIDSFVDDFISEVETNHLCCFGGTDFNKKTFDNCITSDKKRGRSKRLYQSVTEEQKRAMVDWCMENKLIEKMDVGELKSFW